MPKCAVASVSVMSTPEVSRTLIPGVCMKVMDGQ